MTHHSHRRKRVVLLTCNHRATGCDVPFSWATHAENGHMCAILIVTRRVNHQGMEMVERGGKDVCMTLFFSTVKALKKANDCKLRAITEAKA